MSAAGDDSVPSAERERSYSGGYMRVGRTGEAAGLLHLNSLPNIETVEDLRDDLDYQARDIDARFKLRGGIPHTIEFKTDNHLDASGRWLFELYRINLTAAPEHSFVPSWSVRSEAEWLMFYAPVTRRLHFITMEEYRQAFKEAIAAGQCQFGLVQTDRIKRTLNAYFAEGFATEMPSYRVVPEASQ